MHIDEDLDELAHPTPTRRPLRTSRELGHQHRRRARQLTCRVDADQLRCRCRDPFDELQHSGLVRSDLGVFDDLVGADISAKHQPGTATAGKGDRHAMHRQRRPARHRFHRVN